MTKVLGVDKKKINRTVLLMVIPIILENVLQMTAGLITTAMIGRLTADDISAQGVCLRLTNTCWALFKGIGMGATVVIALRFGQRRLQQCRRTAEQTYLTAMPLALICMAVLIVFPAPFLSFFAKDAVLIAKGTDYLRIAIWGLPFTALCSLNTGVFNGHGNTKTPMVIAILLNVVNIVVGYVMIFGVGGFGGYGLIGAAIAYVASQAVGALAGLLLLYRRGGYLREEAHGLKFFSFDKEIVKDVYKTGIPAALENLFWQFAASLLSKIILLYGSNYFAAYQMGLQAEMICEMPGIGFVTAATTLSARAIGQRDDKYFRAYFVQMRKFAFFTGLFSSLMLFLFPMLFMRVLTNNAEIQLLGATYVFIMGFAQIPQDINKIYNGFIRSSGYRNVPMYVGAIGIWLVRVPLAFLFGWILHWPIEFIWIAIALDQIVRMLVCIFVFQRKKVINTVSNLPPEPEPEAV